MSKQVIIKARVSEEQRNLIEKYAEESGSSTSEYIRTCCLKKRVRSNSKNIIISEIITLYQTIEKKSMDSELLMKRIEELIVSVSKK